MRTTLFILVFLPACAASTPEFDIHFQGVSVNPSEIDTSWRITAQTAKFSTHIVDGQWSEFTFTAAPIVYDNTLFSGITSQTFSQVYANGCITSNRVALIHEMFHQAKFIMTGDNDAGHEDSHWKAINAAGQDCSPGEEGAAQGSGDVSGGK